MCLVIGVNEPEQTAAEDMKVYKCVRGVKDTFRAPYMNFAYTLGHTYHTEMEDGEISCFDGRDSTYLGATFPDWAENAGNDDSEVKAIGRGFHAATDPERFRGSLMYKVCIVECTIPAGSKFYTNGDFLIVSNAIRIDKILIPENLFYDWQKGEKTLEECIEEYQEENA